jgi:tetratricopeptide (TPR) repeat protein
VRTWRRLAAACFTISIALGLVGLSPLLKLRAVTVSASGAQSGIPQEASGQNQCPTFSDPTLHQLEQCVEKDDRKCVERILPQIRGPKFDDSPDVLDLKARAFTFLRRRDEALKAIKRAIEANPHQYRYRVTEGRIYQNFNDQVSAIRSFLLADGLQPRSPDTFYSIGMSFFLLGDYERSSKHFVQTLEINPQYHKAEFMMGIIDMIHFRQADAKVELEKALALQPDNAFYHLYYGILLGRMDDNSSGLRELMTARSLNPSYAMTRFNLGRLLGQKGDYQAAKTELEEAVRLRPSFPAAYYQLAQTYHHLGMEEESTKAYKEFQTAKAEEDKEAKDPVESAVSRAEPEPGTAH